MSKEEAIKLFKSMPWYDEWVKEFRKQREDSTEEEFLERCNDPFFFLFASISFGETGEPDKWFKRHDEWTDKISTDHEKDHEDKKEKYTNIILFALSAFGAYGLMYVIEKLAN